MTRQCCGAVCGTVTVYPKYYSGSTYEISRMGVGQDIHGSLVFVVMTQKFKEFVQYLPVSKYRTM